MGSALTCPVCQGAMREVERESVVIDVCTRCRGVWLDRGELEKLSGLMSASSFERDRGRVTEGDRDRRETSFGERRWRGDDDDDDDRFKHQASGYGHRKKSGMSRFLDFFD